MWGSGGAARRHGGGPVGRRVQKRRWSRASRDSVALAAWWAGAGVSLVPPQVESWTKQDQKLLEAVERGDVGRVAALAARKAARPAKLNAAGQSAYVTPGRGDTRGSRALTWVTTPSCRPGSTWLRPGV